MSGAVEQNPPIDAATRRRLRVDHDRTFFVEAGAGTGKTTALVSRVVALVARGELTMPRLVAITFTEAAAAELRDRIRRDLDLATADEGLDEPARERCRVAAREVDLAAISTIHAFAGTLLRTYPLAAGLPPGFEVLDTIQQDLQLDERFRVWLYEEVPSTVPANRARRDALRRALMLGMSVADVRDLVRALQEHTDLIEPTTSWPSEAAPDPVALARAWGARLLDLRRFIPFAKQGRADPLVIEILKLEHVALRLTAAGDPDEALRVILDVAKPRTNVGSQANYRPYDYGKNPVPFIKETLRRVWAEIEATIDAHRRAALTAVLAAARDYTVAYAEERRRRGVATFHDLLTWTRDLLRDNPEVRALAQRRFDRVFVDEFQDTDPLQAEIVWLLAEDPSTAPAAHWLQVSLQSGKLFLVGDPKQSIYRFRRADIAVYAQVTARAREDERALLVQNFRSVPPILDWINAYFSQHLREETGIQARYVELVATAGLPSPRSRLHAHVGEGTGVRGDPSTSNVFLVGGPIAAKIDEVRRQEAESVARLVRQAVDRGDWMVRGEDGPRPACYADFCVLLPKRANLGQLEDALERFGVPYRIEGGSLVLDTPEVRDLRACLRAIDDPSDQVALVAALRSGGYACSDVHLLDWVEGGGALEFEHVPVDATGPVADALRSLACFHAARIDRSAAATIEAFLSERALTLGALASPRPREAWRRLRYVMRQARLLASAGRPGLRALLDWLEIQRVANLREPESPLPEADEDAVRILTVHGAKGLEFPCVVLTGLGNEDEDREARVKVLVDREPGEGAGGELSGAARLAVRCGPFQTADYAAVAEREKRRDEAEKVRLFYVAATRARDHLVLCPHHKQPRAESDKAGLTNHAARVLAAWRDGGTHLARELEPDDPGPALARASPGEPELTADEHRRAEERWRAERAELVRRRSASSTIQVGALEVASGGKTGRDVADALLPALALALERAAGDPAIPIDEAARDAARALGVERSLGLLVGWARAVLAEPGAMESVRRSRFWHQLPIGVAVQGVTIRGRVDLVYELVGTGLAVIFVVGENRDPTGVAIPSSNRCRHGAAILALEAVARQPVKRAGVISAVTGRLIPLADLDALKAAARRSLAAL